MDVVRFIASPEVRGLCNAWDPDPAACAVVVSLSQTTAMRERHEALLEIAEGADMPVMERPCCDARDSLRGLLLDYVALEDRLAERMRDADGCYYVCSALYAPRHGMRSSYEDIAVCGTYEECLRHAPDDASMIRVSRRRFGEVGPGLAIDMSSDGRIVGIASADVQMTDDERSVWERSLSGMWCDVPCPFAPGDVVRSCLPGDDGIYVVASAELPDETKRLLSKCGDAVDVASTLCYTVEDDGDRKSVV